MKYLRLLVLSLAVLLVPSCAPEYLDINTDPNNPVDVPARTLMASTTLSMGFHMGSDIHRYSSIYMQQFSGQGQLGVQTREIDRFNVQPTDVNNNFRFGFYAGYLQDLEAIISRTQATSPWYAGIAKVMKAYTFQVLVDLYGDIPYTQAFQLNQFPQPNYDDDAAIYTAIYALLDQAIVDLNAGSSVLVPAADDFIYGGNRTNWRKFARSIQLRMAIHYSEVNPTQATTLLNQLAALPTADFINANSENAGCNFLNLPNQQNPIHQFELQRLDQFYPSRTLVDSMNARLDPRRRFYFTRSDGRHATASDPTTVFVGNLNNDPTQIATPLSRAHIYLRGDTTAASAPVTGRGRIFNYTGAAPQRFMTLAEVNFIRAEATLRFGTAWPGAPTAQQSYTAAITASMQLAGVPTAEINAYLATPSGTLSGSTAAQLQRLITEKWIANYGVSVESWSDWRRTGFPILTAPVGAQLTTIPSVLPYPQAEIDANPKTPARPSVLTARVFWDTRAR